jgi:thioredoxin-like negative regulator of GroEL
MGFFKKLFNRELKSGQVVEIADETFEQMVLAQEIPSVVEFYSTRCSHCHVMTGLLNEIGPDYAGRLNIFKIKTDENPQIAVQYQIQGTPTLIIFKKHRPVGRIVGLMQLNPLKEKLDQLAGL